VYPPIEEIFHLLFHSPVIILLSLCNRQLKKANEMGIDIFSTVNGDRYEIIPVDWRETPQAHVVQADLPGLKREYVKLQTHGGVMEISAKQPEDSGDDKDATWHVRERPISGTRVRRFELPPDADVDAVKASMGVDGVLTVTIPKKEVPKPHVKQVEIEEIRNEGIAKKIVKSLKGIIAPGKAK